MTEPSEPLAWVVFADEDGESDLKDHEGASVDCLVFAKEKDAQDCADDGRYDDQEPRRIVPLYPAAPAPDEMRLRAALEFIKLRARCHPLNPDEDPRSAALHSIEREATAALASPEGPGGEEGRDG